MLSRGKPACAQSHILPAGTHEGLRRNPKPILQWIRLQKKARGMVENISQNRLNSHIFYF